jgi:cobalamin 5'-phosphate synthase/cobalamin synthase
MFIVRAFSGFILAFSMLSTLPFLKIHNFFKGINGYAVMFYPLVGLFLGTLVSLFIYLLEPYLSNTYLFVLGFVLWVVLTGALHLDGVADVFDALFVPKSRRESVLKDPHVGAMGMIFTMLFILVKLFAFMQIQEIFLLPVVLMLARFNASLAIYIFPYVRQDGMASLAKSEFTLWQLFTSFLLVFIIGFLFSPLWSLVMLVLMLLPLVIVYLVAKRAFGGFSGDFYGLLIESSEWVLLHVLIFVSLS